MDEELHRVDGVVDGADAGGGEGRWPLAQPVDQLVPVAGGHLSLGAIEASPEWGNSHTGREIGSRVPDDEVSREVSGAPRIRHGRSVGADAEKGVAEGLSFLLCGARHRAIVSSPVRASSVELRLRGTAPSRNLLRPARAT